MRGWLWRGLVALLTMGCAADWTPEDADGDGYTILDGDCDDADPRRHPGATEVCDVQDNDCSGVIDDLAPTSDDPDSVAVYADLDNDGYGGKDADSYLGRSCTDMPLPQYQTTDFTDCDDEREDVYPGATEVCDGVDNNCDGTVDEGCTA